MGISRNPEVARWFASTKHADQRYGQQPYTYHLESAVTELHKHVLILPALRYHDHDVIVCATWLHDVVEDTGTSLDELGRLFTPQVCELVNAVTDEPGHNRKERKAGVYKKIRTIGAPALAVKLSDRLANALTCGLSKDANSMLDLYRKEQPQFELELLGASPIGPARAFEPVFETIRSYLGMEAV